MTAPVVLCVLDGVGESAERMGNAVALAETPVLDRLRQEHATTVLAASGAAVGGPAGTASSELSHLALGAGRAVPSVRTRIDDAIERRRFGVNAIVDQTMRSCLYDGCPLHLFGLLSDEGVHSCLDHLYALLDLADFHGIPVVLHAFLDGRAGGRRRALDYLQKVELLMEGRRAQIGTLSGRYYAMDRDERWDRTYQAFHAIVRDKVLGPTARSAETPFDALRESYGNGIDDEHVVPVRIGDYDGLNGEFMCDFSTPGAPWEWTGEDVGFAFNFRADRIWQLSAMLTRKDLPAEVADDLLMDQQRPTRAFRERCYATMTDYAGLPVPVAFPREPLQHTFARVVSEAGLRQLRIAENEKSTHVERFFNGYQPRFEGEERRLIRSTRSIDHYEEQPAMHAREVADAAGEGIRSGDYAFVLVSFANPDVLAHGGDLRATIAAVEAVDTALGAIVAASREAGGTLLITGSHGNCEAMERDTGAPNTAHTDAGVPFLWIGDDAPPRGALREGGSLADVAPTMLELLGLDPPAVMTGRSLRADR